MKDWGKSLPNQFYTLNFVQYVQLRQTIKRELLSQATITSRLQ